MTYPDNINFNAFDTATGGGKYEMPEHIRESLDARIIKADNALESVLNLAEIQFPRLLKAEGVKDAEIDEIMREFETSIKYALSSIYNKLYDEASEYGEEDTYTPTVSKREATHRLAAIKGAVNECA